jgi:hypothetical protein
MRSLFIILFAAGCSSQLSSQDFDKMSAQARACQAGDSCVLAGRTKCSCFASVNANQQSMIDEAATHVVCPDNRNVQCDPAPGYSPQCVNGQCQ